MADETNLRATMAATLARFMEAHGEAIKNKDMGPISAVLGPGCTRSVTPAETLKEIGLPGDLTAGLDDMAAQFGAQLTFVEAQTEHNVLNSVIDAAKRTAAVRIRMALKLKGRDEPFQTEYCLFLDFDEEGRKINKITEFVDAVRSQRFIQIMGEMAQGK
jgi:hypothetical protein